MNKWGFKCTFNPISESWLRPLSGFVNELLKKTSIVSLFWVFFYDVSHTKRTKNKVQASHKVANWLCVHFYLKIITYAIMSSWSY